MSRLYRKNRDLSAPIEKLELRVHKPDDGVRLDVFLAAKLPWRSRQGAQALIEEGAAQLNGQRRKSATRLRAGDLVVVTVKRPPPVVPPRQPVLRILFEDEHLLVLDKESGVVVHPVGVHQQGTLLQEVHRELGPHHKLCHRLDQFTSGVLLVARTDAVRTAFSEMLERGEVRKEYEALVLNPVTWDEQTVTAPIGPVLDSRILMRVDEERGKSAHSVFHCRERYAFASHVAVRIGTGRTHQIRVHAAHLGHPLLGDHLYGDGIPVGMCERFALHARTVRVQHPATGAPLVLQAPLPVPFKDAQAILREEQA